MIRHETCPARARPALAARTLWPALALVMLLPAQAQAGDEKKAKDLYQQAVELAKDGKYAEAVPLFEEAFALGAPPVALYNIGRCYESLGKFGLAVDYYSRYVAAPDVEDAEEVKATIEKLESKPSRVFISTDPSGAEVSEVLGDEASQKLGTTPLEFSAEAGEHEYLVEKEGYKSKTITITASLAKPFNLELKLSKKLLGEATPGGEEPADKGGKRSPLGLYVEAGGGAVIHAYKVTGAKTGGDASLEIGWRFAHRVDTGFSVGLRVSFRPYWLESTSANLSYLALFTTVLAVPAFQLRLHERLSVMASLPIGIAILDPIPEVPRTTEIDLVGGSIRGGGIALLDIGAGIALRILIVAGLTIAIEPVHLHVLVPLSTWQNDTKALTDVDMVVRVGFEF